MLQNFDLSKIASWNRAPVYGILKTISLILIHSYMETKKSPGQPHDYLEVGSKPSHLIQVERNPAGAGLELSSNTLVKGSGSQPHASMLNPSKLDSKIPPHRQRVSSSDMQVSLSQSKVHVTNDRHKQFILFI